ncbi:MAG: dUTP diphosphatase [Candidatus Caenarcaniphilales bacterium]|nr:dUTP diphosphatase [Candidatus Caenarcaniphilales bacterium]
MSQQLQIQIKKLHPEVQTPFYATPGSAGFDLRAFLMDSSSITIPAGKRAKVTTGLQMVLPEGYELQIRPRSGLAFKHGISLTNTPGTIDCDYRGEIQILMINHGEEDFTIEHGDRIAQAVLAPIYQASFEEITELPSEEDNKRLAGGFGSSGVK